MIKPHASVEFCSICASSAISATPTRLRREGLRGTAGFQSTAETPALRKWVNECYRLFSSIIVPAMDLTPEAAHYVIRFYLW